MTKLLLAIYIHNKGVPAQVREARICARIEKWPGRGHPSTPGRIEGFRV